ncbi:hypothetical protein E8D34_08660 [Nocardioides sp. GY 10113]|uniref:hypothetical protein n=1 Tax=Nocardioides sp. GY 10113 TaxID=2569761 RepID=UPI0010A87B78|nr:hypothetical protein [Nocardioides sp. GY 10113]TIC87735.1 hypothetical protein E8D34_08660 [Nocardioides sp. GY 10113]
MLKKVDEGGGDDRYAEELGPEATFWLEQLQGHVERLVQYAQAGHSSVPYDELLQVTAQIEVAIDRAKERALAAMAARRQAALAGTTTAPRLAGHEGREGARLVS